MNLRETTADAENHGVMKVWWPGALVAAGIVFFGAVRSGTVVMPGPTMTASAAGGGGVAAAAIAGLALHRRRTGERIVDGGLRAAVQRWDEGEVDSVTQWVADLVSQEAANHAARTASLCQHMADQLAVRPDETDELLLAAFAHVSPGAFETGDGQCGSHAEEALATAVAAVTAAAHPTAGTILAQVGERWDGSGSPRGLAGEAALLRGRILAVACAFDRASVKGLEAGLTAIREGSGSAFDPVVAAELLHLFREPWQLRQAA